MKSIKNSGSGRYVRVRPSASTPGKYTITVQQDDTRNRVRLDLPEMLQLQTQISKLALDAIA